MSAIKLLEERLQKVGCEYFINEPMKLHTTFKIGGNADVFVVPENEEQSVLAISACRDLSIPYTVIGNGSNLLVKDGGIRGAVIAFTGKMGKISLSENVIEAQSGTLLVSVCRFAAENSLSGLEFAFGIPGSVGGATYMNAGAYGGEIRDVVLSVKALFPDGQVRELSGDEAKFGYRTSVFEKNDAVILSAKFKLAKDNKDEIEARMNDVMQRRKDKQPLEWPSAGSTFKRPQNGYAAAMIDQCGLKGRTFGGAQVSEKHAGFVINKSGASCSDVLNLMQVIKNEVFSKTGVELHPEVKIIGEER